MPQPVAVGLPENPKPGSEGATTARPGAHVREAAEAAALLAEGGLPDDPAAYVKRVNALLV